MLVDMIFVTNKDSTLTHWPVWWSNA